jgi:hypothetical protein
MNNTRYEAKRKIGVRWIWGWLRCEDLEIPVAPASLEQSDPSMPVQLEPYTESAGEAPVDTRVEAKSQWRLHVIMLVAGLGAIGAAAAAALGAC